jgi:hypothetical protein
MKFTNFKHNYKPGLALELNSSLKERTKNKSQANKADDTVICFTEVRFLQTYSPLRWSQRPGLFQPFPSLKRSLRPSELLFSIKRDTKSPQGPPHNWCLLLRLQGFESKNERKKKANQAIRTTKEHKSIFSQVLKTRVEFVDFDSIDDFDLCLGVLCIALVLNEQ